MMSSGRGGKYKAPPATLAGPKNLRTNYTIILITSYKTKALT